MVIWFLRVGESRRDFAPIGSSQEVPATVSAWSQSVSEYPCCGAFCTGEVHSFLGVCFPGPGLGPAADLLFFASPKKRRQKKGDP
ncbi:hypothetical protein, partial [uncultured Variovorax sp.]|uniref:hypothetical protein n=1 Tax=uncultured Variovorax sp. TaxID=114708 RepID=UPI00261FF81D